MQTKFAKPYAWREPNVRRLGF